MKKNYSKPSMQVFNLKQRPVLLCGSNGEKVFDEPVEEPEIPQAKGYDDWFN